MGEDPAQLRVSRHRLDLGRACGGSTPTAILALAAWLGREEARRWLETTADKVPVGSSEQGGEKK